MAMESFELPNSPEHVDDVILHAAEPENTPDKKPEQKENPIDERAWERAIAYNREWQTFRYGELPEDNPAQKLAQSIADKLPQKEGMKLRPHVLAKWNVMNAMALPDGNVYIGKKLIEEAESEEGLAGIIAHEHVHAYREHSLKQQKKQKQHFDFKPQDILSSFGQKRIHEYEADLRGCIKDLEEAGINPIGYKVLLEKIHEKKDKGGGDIAHGSSMDRALNIASAAYLVDLKSLATGLHDISPEVIKSLELEEGKDYGDYEALFFSSEAFSWLPDEQKKIREEKQEILKKLPTEKLLFAIDAAMEVITSKRYAEKHSKSKPKKKSDTDEDVEILNLLLKRFQSETTFQDETLEEKDRQFLLDFSIVLAADNKNTKEFFTAYIKTSEDAAHFAELLDKHIQELPVQFAKRTTNSVAQSFFRHIVSEKIHSDELFKSWSDVFEKVSQEKDLVRVVRAEDLFNTAKLIAQGKSDMDIEKTLSMRDQILLYEKPDIQRLAKQIIEPNDRDESLKIFRKIRPEFFETYLKDKPFDEAVANIREFSNYLQNELISNRRKVNEAVESKASQEYFEDVLPSLRTLQLLKDYLDYEVNEGRMTDLERSSVLMTNSHGLGIDNSLDTLGDRILQAKREKESGKTGFKSVDKDREYLIKKIPFLQRQKKEILQVYNPEEYLKYAATATLEDISAIYKMLTEDFLKTINLTIVKSNNRFFNTFFNVAFKDKSLEEILAAIKYLKNDHPHIEQDLFSGHESTSVTALKFVEYVEKSEFDYEKIPLGTLLQMCELISSPFLRLSLQRYLLNQNLEVMTFDQKLDLFYPPAGMHGVDDPKAQEMFIEKDIKTKDQFEQVKDRAQKSIESLSSEGDDKFGVVAILSTLGVESTNINEFVEGLLESSKSDRKLKLFVLSNVTTKPFNDEDTIDDPDSPLERVRISDKAVRFLFTMDEIGKQLLLRQLMTARGGLLRNEENKGKFLKYLFDRWIEKDEKQQGVYDVLMKSKEGLMAIKDWQVLYFALQSTLRDKIAIPPAVPTPWYEFDVSSWFSEEIMKQKKLKSSYSYSIHMLSEKQTDNPYKYSKEYSAHVGSRLQTFLLGKNMLTQPGNEVPKPIGFVKDTASKTGTQGVRFLQLLPQFVQLDPTYEEEFSEVYDSLHGQSKLSALLLLEREWPEMWNEITEIGDRVGGGSAMTVYDARGVDGSEDVIKVRNPNIEYHLDETNRFAEDVMDTLARKYGGGYASSKAALSDIKEWILNDINFKNFVSSDKDFFETHNGFAPENFEYSIKIPKSKGPENQFFIREEKITGKNLTKWDELVKEGHDMKQIASLAIKNYIYQIATGKAQSDVHIGNYRVTPDKKLAILDRNYYLTIDNRLQNLITSLMTRAETSKKQVTQYLISEGGTFNTQRAEKIIDKLLDSAKEFDWKKAQASIVELKQIGVKIPLTLTLLLKNLNSLQLICTKAAFSGIREAFDYEPSQA